MKRLPSAFYKELHTLRDRYGETEYQRDDILPATMGLINKHLKGDGNELLRDAANAILDSAEKTDDAAGGRDFFPQFAHVALGDKMRIKRGAMEIPHVTRRKRVIDHNKEAQDGSWADETRWLNACADALHDKPIGTKVADVMAESAAA